MVCLSKLTLRKSMVMAVLDCDTQGKRKGGDGTPRERERRRIGTPRER